MLGAVPLVDACLHAMALLLQRSSCYHCTAAYGAHMLFTRMGRYQQTRTNTIAIKAFDTSGLVWGCMCATGRARCYLVSVLMRQAIAVLGQPSGRH